MVESEGQFAVRGDILDIFSPGKDKPCRINFFGDEVENIKYFDPGTQRSEEEDKSVLILPCNEQTGSIENRASWGGLRKHLGYDPGGWSTRT